MAIERTYYCEGPDCGDAPDGPSCHAKTASPPPHLPSGFIETRTREAGVDYVNHFCSWPCAMKYAAAQPIPEVVRWEDIAGDDA